MQSICLYRWENKNNLVFWRSQKRDQKFFAIKNFAWLLKQKVLWNFGVLYPLKHLILWFDSCKVGLPLFFSAYCLSQSWSSWSGWAFWAFFWSCVEIFFVRQPCWLLAPISTTSSRTKRPAVTCWSPVGSTLSLGIPHMWAGSTGAQEHRWDTGLLYTWILLHWLHLHTLLHRFIPFMVMGKGAHRVKAGPPLDELPVHQRALYEYLWIQYFAQMAVLWRDSATFPWLTRTPAMFCLPWALGPNTAKMRSLHYSLK